MKRILCLVLLITMLLACFNGCVYTLFTFKTDDEIASELTDAVLVAVSEQDKNALKALFSDYTITSTEDFDSSLDSFFAYYQGEFVSWQDSGAQNVFKERDDGLEKTEMHLSFDVTTSDQVYRFAICYYPVNDYDPDQVGIRSLCVLKLAEDQHPAYVYRGDQSCTPGIHVGLQGTVPEEKNEGGDVT